MLDTVRKYVEASRDALSQQKAEDVARKLARQGQIRRDQVGKMARDLAEWSRKNSERLTQMIRQEVKRQMTKTGVATKDEVEGLKRRIRELEKGTAGATAPKTASGAKKTSTAKASRAKKSTARKRTT